MCESLFNIASKFRDAIQTAIICGDITEINMRQFPFGCCGYTCDLFQRYLDEIGIATLYCSGQYGYGWHAKNHVWLETRDGTVIDITGDEFANETPRFSSQYMWGQRKMAFMINLFRTSP